MSRSSSRSRHRPDDELTATKRRCMQIYAAFTGVRNVLRQLPCDNMSHAARTQTCPASRSLHKMPTNKNAPAFLIGRPGRLIIYGSGFALAITVNAQWHQDHRQHKGHQRPLGQGQAENGRVRRLAETVDLEAEGKH